MTSPVAHRAGLRALTVACVMLVASFITRSAAQTPTPASATPQAAAMTSSAAGIYTAEQAERGEQTFSNNCVGCHASSKFTDPAFRTAWNGKSLFDLYDLVSQTMPEDFPGALAPTEYADAIAYLLKLNRAPTGEAELAPDPVALKKIRLDLVSRATTPRPPAGG